MSKNISVPTGMDAGYPTATYVQSRCTYGRMHPLDWQRRGRTREPDDGPPATRLVGHLLEGRGGRVGSMDRFFWVGPVGDSFG